MENSIYFKDLPCYTDFEFAENSRVYKNRNRIIHLESIPTDGLRQELRSFIEYRGNGTTIKASSLISELWKFHRVCDFLADTYSNVSSLLDVPEEQLLKDMRRWMLKNGYNLSEKKFKKQLGKETYREGEILSYLKSILTFLTLEGEAFSLDQDIWNIYKLPFEVRTNPVLRQQTVNFSKIRQDGIKQEMKKVSYMRLKNKALGTIQAELVAVNRFSGYLVENEEAVQSFGDLNRDIVEGYLIYLNTEENKRKSYSTDLSHLKTIVEMAGRMIEKPEICNLFLLTDLPKRPIKQFQSYSDKELMRLNREIVDLNPQVARVLMTHQLLGTRISDTLTLLQDCISVVDRKYVITVFQVKTRRTYKKTVNEDVVALINAAIAYTNKIHGESKYVFASESEPDKPISYSKIQYQVMTMIQEKQLKDDQGELFGCWTHMFRSTYGRKLTEMHVDDITIAKLLGHSGVASVKHYRKMGDMVLASETKSMRQTMDEILANLIEGW